MQAAKTPQALCLYLACLRGGFVFHPLNTGYRAGELEYFFSDAEPAMVVCDSGNLDMIRPLVKQLSIPRLFTLDGDGSGTLADRSRSSWSTAPRSRLWLGSCARPRFWPRFTTPV